MAYKVDAYYSPADDRNLRWNDPAIGIEWPNRRGRGDPSGKDKAAPFLADLGGSSDRFGQHGDPYLGWIARNQV